MNIVVLARDFPKSGGRITFVKNLMKETSEFNYRLITYNKTKEKNTICLKRIFHDGLFGVIEYHLRCVFSLYRLKPDLVLGTGLSATGGMLFSKIKNVPGIYNLSGVRGSEKPEKNLMVKVKKKKTGFGIKRLYQAFAVTMRFFIEVLGCWLTDYITVPSVYCKIKVINRVPLLNEKKIIPLNEGINIKTDSIKSKVLKKCGYSDKDKIVVFSRFEEAPYEKIFSEIINEIPNVKLIHIKARTIDILKNTKMQETDLRVKDVFKIGHILVCPPYWEPHSYTVLEALKFNMSVFVSKVGWLEYEFKEYPDFLIKKVSANAIIKKIRNYYKNPEKFQEQTKNIKRKMQGKYDYKKCMKSYVELFNSFG